MAIRIDFFEPQKAQLVLKAVHGDPKAYFIEDYYSGHDVDPFRLYLRSDQPRYFQIWNWTARRERPLITGWLWPDETGGRVQLKGEDDDRRLPDNFPGNTPYIPIDGLQFGLLGVRDSQVEFDRVWADFNLID